MPIPSPETVADIALQKPNTKLKKSLTCLNINLLS